MNIDNVLTAPILPVIILNDSNHAIPLAKSLVEGGITTFEITLRTPAAIDSIRRIRKALPERYRVGAGTITKLSQFDEVKEAGADFAVSPGISSELIKAAQKVNIPYLPGIVTPSELLLAIQHGLSFVKFFPADLNGGPQALRSFMNVFPKIKFCPTGGINQKNMKDYLSLENVVCVGGSWIAPQNLIDREQWQSITNLVSKTLEAIKK